MSSFNLNKLLFLSKKVCISIESILRSIDELTNASKYASQE